MTHHDNDPLEMLGELARADRERFAEWDAVLVERRGDKGLRSIEEVAQLMRARGVSEEEVARAIELFRPFSRDEEDALIARVRSSGGHGESVAGSFRRYRLLPEVSMSWITLLILVVLILAVIPAWPYSNGWGYNPAGILGVVLVLLLVLKLLHKI